MSINEIKTVVNIPWANQEYGRPSNQVDELEAYSQIPLIFRAINLRCDSLTRVPVYVYDEQSEIIEEGYQWEEMYPLRDLLWLSEVALLLRGQAFNLILKRRLATDQEFQKGLQWINPFSITADEEKDGTYRYYQLVNGRKFPADNYWHAEDFLPMRLFNPMDDLGFGISPTYTALGNAKIFKSIDVFLGNYFGSGALPVTLLSFPKGASKDEALAAETWFKKQLKAMRRATERVLGISGELKVDKLTADLNTFDFDKIDDHAINNVSWAFSIPKTILTSDSANRATAETEYRSYLDYTILPRCKFYEKAINPYLVQFDQRIEFAPQEMTEMQEDEAKRSVSLKTLVDSGVPLDAALDILGYDLSKEAQASIDKKINPDATTTVGNASNDTRQPIQGQDPNQPNPEQIKAELDKWLRKSISHLKAKGSADVEFESDKIPAELKSVVRGKLGACKTEDEVRIAFKGG